MQVELQRQAQEILLDIAADHLDHVQRLDIAGEQQVLAVVELGVVIHHAARALRQVAGRSRIR